MIWRTELGFDSGRIQIIGWGLLKICFSIDFDGSFTARGCFSRSHPVNEACTGLNHLSRSDFEELILQTH